MYLLGRVGGLLAYPSHSSPLPPFQSSLTFVLGPTQLQQETMLLVLGCPKLPGRAAKIYISWLGEGALVLIPHPHKKAGTCHFPCSHVETLKKTILGGCPQQGWQSPDTRTASILNDIVEPPVVPHLCSRNPTSVP